MLRNPTAHLLSNTLAITSIVFACGFACGYGLAVLAGMPSPEYAGLSVGGCMAALAVPIYVSFALADSREYWRYRQMLGKTEPPPEPRKVDFHRLTLETDATSTEIYYLPVTTEQLISLNAGLTRNKSLSGRMWYGPGKPFAQPVFIRLRREMERRGLAEKIGNSFALSDKGVDAFARGEVSPIYTNANPPETYPLYKRGRIVNRGSRGVAQGARK